MAIRFDTRRVGLVSKLSVEIFRIVKNMPSSQSLKLKGLNNFKLLRIKLIYILGGNNYGFNNKRFLMSKGFLINKFGQVFTTNFLLFLFSMRFYRFINRRR